MDILARLFNSFTGQISYTLPGGARPYMVRTGLLERNALERIRRMGTLCVHTRSFIHVVGPKCLRKSHREPFVLQRVPRVTCYPLQPDVVSGRNEVDLCTPKNGGGISPAGPHLREARQVNHECQIIRAVIFRSTQQNLSVRPEVTEMTIFLTAFTTTYLSIIECQAGGEVRDFGFH